MKKLIYIDEARKKEILAWAIEHRTRCVLTSHAGLGWQTAKAQFVADASEKGQLVLAFENRDGAPAPSYSPGERVGLSFRRGHKKCMCASVVLSTDRRCVNGESESDCIELRWPEAMQELQRRVYYRATPSRRVHVRYWAGGVAKRGDAEQKDNGVRFGILLDLSAGGMRIRPADPAEHAFDEGDAIGCAFAPKPRSETLILDAVYRHLQREEDGSCSIGLQFVGLETSERGRQLLAELANVVTEYHRGASRSQRRPLAGTTARS